jgi:FkbM family methyltransferase
MRRVLHSIAKEVEFALTKTASFRDAVRLLARTARFHLANRKLAPDGLAVFSINLVVGEKLRHLTLRAGQVGDLFVLYEVLAWRAYRISEKLIIPHQVKTIIDCGANIGFTALYFASIYPNAKIYSIEPDPSSFSVLKLNAAQEPRIIPIHGCIVAEQTHTVAFDTSGPAWGRKLSTTQTAKSIGVPSITLDDLIKDHSIEQIDLIKMDIEGAERAVLSTGSYLARTKSVVAELHDGYSFCDFSNAVARHGLQARPPDSQCGLPSAHRN